MVSSRQQRNIVDRPRKDRRIYVIIIQELTVMALSQSINLKDSIAIEQ